MKKMKVNEIREAYLKFFESKGHLRLPSFSLVPEDDPSVLLINAGMTPLKPYFTKAKTPPSLRVTTCQKCIRTPDIERVGMTARHGTFFEMLGNFSFGDYFKQEAISWAWEFITRVLEMPEDRLYVTVYENDQEAYDIWHDQIGLASERIYKFGKEDNFWEHGTGPCGPCSEIFFDRGEQYGCGSPDCQVGCECDRFVEFWNLVFTQFNRDAEGNYTELASKNIDTGGGLERFAAIMQDVDNLFEIDSVRAILDSVCQAAGVEYGRDDHTDVAIRVITDHLRSATMMISDRIRPGNSGRGYVLRRLIRRAARYGRILKINRPFLYDLARVVIRESEAAYPELADRADEICSVLLREEESFRVTVEQGSAVLDSYIAETKAAEKNRLTGDQVFKLHDTYGFPVDLTREIAAEAGLEIDQQAFDACMAEQKRKGREDFLANSGSAWDKLQLPADIDKTKPTEFIGYEGLTCEARVKHLLQPSEDGLEEVETVDQGSLVFVVTDKTPFYAERGGQVGDAGVIQSANGRIKVKQTTHTGDDIYLHQGEVVEGEVSRSDKVEMKVDGARRMAIMRNHTTTHMLHHALRQVLGDHVSQAGSLVAPDRLRFDFTHPKPVTADELAEIERLVNQAILANDQVTTREMDLAEAKEIGAMALFGEKYADRVRVVQVGDSIELCGGTHLTNSAEAGSLRIINETGVASGIRRVEALTGQAAYDYTQAEHQKLSALSDLLNVQADEAVHKLESLLQEQKHLSKQLEKVKNRESKDLAAGLLDRADHLGKGSLLVGRFENLTAEQLRDIGDQLKDKLERPAIVLSSVTDGKVLWLAMTDSDVVKSGVNLGKLLRQAAKITQGGGGGRPDMAQAGGKNPDKLPEALDFIKSELKKILA